jgi:glycine cleavage system H lipoate-binding protein
MRCPYLKEANVKQCGNSAWRKMIVQQPAGTGDEKCASSSYAACPVYRGRSDEAPPDPRCPYFEEKVAEYCAVSPVPQLVPYTEAESRCKSDSYKYCEVFRGQAPRRLDDDGIDAPADLYYSVNHLWFDAAADGGWHLGIDSLLAKVMGSVDRVTFVTLNGVDRPAVILTVNGFDLEVVFPNPLPIDGVNLHLRAHPAGLTSDPYAIGWLFEGRQHGDLDAATRGLMRGRAAMEWMRKDMARISGFAGGEYMADGGVPCDVMRHLERDQALPLFHELFSLARVGSGR